MEAEAIESVDPIGSPTPQKTMDAIAYYDAIASSYDEEVKIRLMVSYTKVVESDA